MENNQDTQNRLNQYLAAKSVGADERTATIGAFPEYSPEAMSAQIPEMIKAPVNTPLTDMHANKASEELSRTGMVQNLIDQGMDAVEANNMYKEIFTGLPDGEQPADYDRLDRMLSSGRSRAATDMVDTVSDVGETISNVDFARAAIQGSLGTSQQALFGLLIGEKVGDVVDRFWPDADIRDDDGVVQRKAVFPMASKAVQLGTMKLLLKAITFGKVGVPDEVDKQLEQYKLALTHADYMNGMITGREVLEHWMNGDNIIGTRLPDVGTPERAAYDKQVSDNAANVYNEVSSEPGGTGHIAAIATAGALMDVFVDPLLVVSEVPVLGLKVARNIAPAASKAEVLSAMAERTERLPAVLDALNGAKKWAKEAQEAFHAKPTDANKAKLEHATKMVVRWENRATKASHPGEQVLLRTHPHLDPDHAKLVGREYLGADAASRRHVTEQFIKNQLAKYEEANVGQWNSIVDQLDNAIEEGGQEDLVKNLEEQLRLLQKPADQWKETMKWFKERMKAEKGSRTAAFFKQAISKQTPYQAEQLPVPMKSGEGFTAEVPVERGPTEAAKNIGPAISMVYSDKIDDIARKVAAGAPAEDILEKIQELTRLSAHETKTAFELGKDRPLELYVGLNTEAREALKTRLNISDAEVDELYAQHNKELYDRWEKVDSTNRLSGMAQELMLAYTDGDLTSANEMMDYLSAIILDATEPKGPPLKTRAGNSAVSAAAGGATGDNELTLWQQIIDTAHAKYGKAEVVPFSKAQALKAVQDNITRGMAQGAPESEIIQWENTYTNIQNGTLDLSMNIPRSRLNSDDAVAASLIENKREVLDNLSVPALEPVAPQRFEFGPDITESAGEAARGLAAGLDVDELYFYNNPVELYNTSYAAELRPESGVFSRSAKALSDVTKTKVKIKGEDGKVRTKVVTKRGPLAAEDEWLGINPVRTQLEAVKWQKSMAEKLGDFYTRGLYPESYMPRAPWFMQARREVMRTIQSAHPKLFTRMHDAVHAQEYEMIRMAEFFSKELNTLGVYKKVKGTDVLNPEESQRFYRIMNLDPTSKEYSQALSTLNEAQRRSIRRMRQEFNFALQKLGMEDTPLAIEGFIDHVFEARWFDGGARSPQWQGYSAKAQVFNKHMLPRSGHAGYTEDLALALDNYTRAFARKLHLEPLFEDMKYEAARWVRENPGQTWFAKYIDAIINGMQGKPTTLGGVIDSNMSSLNARMRAMGSLNNVAKGVGKVQEKVLGPATYAAGEQLAKLPGKVGKLGGAMQSEGVRVTEFGSTMSMMGVPRYVSGDASRTALGMTALSYSSVLGGSSRYFPMAIATGFVTTSSKFSPLEAVRGITMMATPRGRALAKQLGIDKQWISIMDDAAWTKMGNLAANMPSFNGGTVLGPSISATENGIRGWTLWAAISDLVRKSEFKDWDAVKEAGMAGKYAHEAVRTTEEVNHLFGAFGKNPGMHRFSKSLNTAATQFLSFIPKQTEELLSQTLKNPGRILQYMMISGYVQRVAAKAGLDVSDYVGLGYLPKTPQEATSITTETVVSMMDTAFNISKLAAGYGDKVATKKSAELMLRNMQNFIPLAMATQRAGRGLETLRTGALFYGNKKVRDVDLGQFNWDSHKSVAENLTNLPAGFANGNDAQATEMLSVLSGMNSVAGSLEREQYMKSIKRVQDRIYRRQQILDALDSAIKNEDGQAFDKQIATALEEGMILPDVTQGMERKLIESMVPRLTRMSQQSDQRMLDGMKEEERAVQLYKFRFNR